MTKRWDLLDGEERNDEAYGWEVSFKEDNVFKSPQESYDGTWKVLDSETVEVNCQGKDGNGWSYTLKFDEYRWNGVDGTTTLRAFEDEERFDSYNDQEWLGKNYEINYGYK